MPTATYTLISQTVLLSASSSVTIGSIPGTFRDLVFVVDATTVGSGPYNVGITTNLNTGNYRYAYANGDGSTTAASAPGDNRIQVPGRSSYWSNGYRTHILGNIMDYSTTNKQKPFLIRTGTASGATEMILGQEFGTGAITSINFAIGGSVSQFAVGSIFTLYGIVS